jgi:hypothetical protein
MKYGKFNFLEPSGQVQACNGTAFALSKMVKGKGKVTPKQTYVALRGPGG